MKQIITCSDTKKIRVFKSNKFYRVGNLVLCKGIRWLQDRHVILSEDKYKGTILRSYLDHLQPDIEAELDMDGWVQTIKTFDSAELDDQTLVVNIRMGDNITTHQGVIKNTNNIELDFILNHDSLIESIRNYITNHTIKNILVIAVMHFGDNELLESRLNRLRFNKYTKEAYDRNLLLLSNATSKIKNNFDVDVKFITSDLPIPQFVDQQLMILLKHKHVLLDPWGTFARLIKMTRQHMHDKSQA